MLDRRELEGFRRFFALKRQKRSEQIFDFWLNKHGIYGILNMHGNMHWSAHDRVAASQTYTRKLDYIGREVRYYDGFRNYFGNYRYFELAYCLWKFSCSVSCLSR